MLTLIQKVAKKMKKKKMMKEDMGAKEFNVLNNDNVICNLLIVNNMKSKTNIHRRLHVIRDPPK